MKSGPPRDTTDTFILKSKKKHGDEYIYTNVVYNTSHSKVEIICSKHGPFKIAPFHHIQGQGCPICRYEKTSIKQRDTKDKFIKKSRMIHYDRYEYPDNYINQATPIKIKCNKHNILFTVTPAAHLQKKNPTGCPSCGRESLKDKNSWTIDDFISKSKLVHGNKYEYSISEYKGSLNQIDIICPVHGLFSQQAFSHMRGIGCPCCNESKGERMISQILDKLNIKYSRQQKFDGCKNKYRLRFDFYLPEHNACIEFDGIQHSKSTPLFGGADALTYQQNNDFIKNSYCKNNGINLIRVSHQEPDPEAFLIEKLSI